MRRVVLVLVLCAPLIGCDWTQARFDAGRSGAQLAETTITQANVGTLQEVWRASLGSAFVRGSVPIVAGGRVYAHRGPTELAVFDAAGVDGCAGTPRTCSPLWTMPLPSDAEGAPAVGAGQVFAVAAGELFAFDFAGTTGCSGTPKVCAPLWRTATGGDVHGDPLVVDGRVVVGSETGVVRSYAATPTGCAGAPVVCQPQWRTAPNSEQVPTSSPAAAAGVVYVASWNQVLGFSVAGCPTSPCAPVWRANRSSVNDPIVANGWLYVEDWVFDLAASCPGTPPTCTQRYSMTIYQRGAGAIGGGYLAQQGGAGFFVGYGAYEWPPQPDCPGGAPFCDPDWVCECLDDGAVGGVTIANGMVFGVDHDVLQVFGLAPDDARCRPESHGAHSPIPPTVPSCDPIAAVAVPQVPGAFDPYQLAPVVSGGRVYVTTEDLHLHVLALPS